MTQALPYESATSGERALDDARKILTAFGCASFGHMIDIERGEILVQFKHRERQVSVKVSVNGYAAAWLKRHPYNRNYRYSRTEHERKAKVIAQFAVYSILRDWIKGQVTAIETGILTFEGAFLGQLLLPTGRTVLEEVETRKMLPAPAEQKVVELKQ